MASIKGVDDYVDEIVKKKGRHQYKDGLRPDHWEEDIEKVPLFMTKAPDENAEISDALSAIQALKFDEDDTPDEKALTYKDEGNRYFKLKLYRKAVVAYGEGLKQPVEDVHIRVILLTNRSAAHHHLGNNRSALNDATAACKLEPAHIKARIRGAVACVELERFVDALKWCEEGLRAEPGNVKLLETKQTAQKKLRVQQRNERKTAALERHAQAKDTELRQAIESRGIKLETNKEGEKSAIELAALEASAPCGSRVQLDADGNLLWPVLFLYPEYGQSDFIQAFHEHSCFSDHLDLMFSEALPWDVEGKYRSGQLEVYFEERKSGKFVRISLKSTLAKILSDPRYVVLAGTPSFLIVPKGSADSVLRRN